MPGLVDWANLRSQSKSFLRISLDVSTNLGLQLAGEQKTNLLVEDCMRISDGLLSEFDQEAATTRKCLARIPDDKLSYKPHPKSFGMGALAVHIATMLDWGATTLESDSFDYAPVGGEPYVAPVANTN